MTEHELKLLLDAAEMLKDIEERFLFKGHKLVAIQDARAYLESEAFYDSNHAETIKEIGQHLGDNY